MAGGDGRAKWWDVKVESEADLDTPERSGQVGPGAGDVIPFHNPG
jgi:hypothetical protein